MLWYYASQGKQAGPVDDTALDHLIRQGTIQPSTLVWREGMAQWQALSAARPNAPAAPAPAPAPPPAPAAPSTYMPQPPAAAPQPSYGQPQAPQPSFNQPTFNPPAAPSYAPQPAQSFGQPAQPSFGQPAAPQSSFEQLGFGQPKAAQPQQPAAYGVPAPVAMGSTSQTITCANCGQLFPSSAAVMIGSSWVCANCKPVYMQRMREGGGAAMVGGMKLAGFWMRFLASFIDGIIVGIGQMIITVPLGFVMGASGASSSAAMGYVGLIYFFSIATRAAYETYFVAQKGATPGKQVLGLKVVRPDGGRR